MTAGGGSVLVILLLAILLRGHAVAPTVTVASALAGFARILLFWNSIDWSLVRWYLPGGAAGAVLGAWFFSRASIDLIQVCIGLFLVSTVWQFHSRKQHNVGWMRLSWFLPVAFVSGLTSALVGASGLLANPFYLNYGLTKESMLATRAVNSLSIQIIKVTAYVSFGSISWDVAGHGVAIGFGAVLAVWLTRPWLEAIDPLRFRRLVVSVMVLAGMLILWRQRLWLLRLLPLW